MAVEDASLSGHVKRDPPPRGHVYADFVVLPLAVGLLVWFLLTPRLSSALRALQPGDPFSTYWPLAAMPLLAAAGAAVASSWKKPAFLPQWARWLLWGVSGTLLVVQLIRVPDLQQVARTAETVAAEQEKNRTAHNKEIQRLEDALAKARDAAEKATVEAKANAQKTVDDLQKSIDAEKQKQKDQEKELDKVKKDLADQVEKGKQLNTALADAEQKARTTLPPVVENPDHPVNTPKPEDFAKSNNGQVPELPPPPPPGDAGAKKVIGLMLAGLAMAYPELAPLLIVFGGLFEGDPQTVQTVVDAAQASMKDGKFDVEKFKDYMLKNVDRSPHANPKEVYDKLDQMLRGLKNSPLATGDNSVIVELKKELAKRKELLQDPMLNRIFRVIGWTGVESLHTEWTNLLEGGGSKVTEENVRKVFNEVQQKAPVRPSPQDLGACLRLYAKSKLSKDDYDKFDKFLTNLVEGDGKA